MRNASYAKQDFGLDDVWRMVNIVNAKNILSRLHKNIVLSQLIAIKTTAQKNRAMKDNYCERVGQPIDDCNARKANEHRYESNL